MGSARLQLTLDGLLLREVAVDGEVFRIGRKPDNDAPLDDPAVSGYHCRIVREGETHYVEDLNSTNGTLVNRKRVDRAPLSHKDAITVGRHVLVYLAGAPAEERTERLAPAAPPEPARPSVDGPLGLLKTLKGGSGQHELKELSTYLGKSDRAQIRIQGTGLLGSAPEVAASIHRRPEGYVLVAVKDGYPVVNGTPVSGQTELKDGDILECGGTAFQFVLKKEEKK